MIRRIHLALFTGLLTLLAAHAWANPEWSADMPAPKDHDWIKLTSGEWLKGDFKVLYEDSLEFDSDKLNLLNLDWEDISEVRTAKIIEVRFDDQTVGIGILKIEGNSIYFNDYKDSHTRAQIVSIATNGNSESDYWSIDLSFSGNLKRGNSNENFFDSNFTAKRRTNNSRVVLSHLISKRNVKNSENEVKERVVTEDSHRLNSYYDRFISQRLYWRALSYEYYKDKFQNIDAQQTFGSGIGYTLIDQPKLSWDVTLSPSYQRTKYVTVSTNNEIINESPALVFDNELSYDITSDIEFVALYNATFTDNNSGKYKHHIDLGLEFEITESLDFDITMIWDRTEDPKENEDGLVPLQDDTRLTLGIGYEF